MSLCLRDFVNSNSDIHRRCFCIEACKVAMGPANDGRPCGSDRRSIEISCAHSQTEDMGTANATASVMWPDRACHSHPSVENAARRVLIVSSGIQDRQLLAQLLTSHAYPRYWTSTVQEAADWLSSNSARVVICDGTLPDGDWRAVWEGVRSRPDPPVFIVSASWTDARLWAELLNVGAYDVLVKPYEKSEVSRILQHACRTFEHCA
jgi:CheY-like chemotaxis protein